ncbi:MULTISPECIES: hypothetical protein [Sphingobacterium]|uniref:hypothetical protein n=1 Tax=Sphingobacterium TaxID=28453 RepID=UPI00257D34F9|nr:MULTISPECIES: hypothetical protein [Sphingobacterium]
MTRQIFLGWSRKLFGIILTDKQAFTFKKNKDLFYAIKNSHQVYVVYNAKLT